MYQNQNSFKLKALLLLIIGLGLSVRILGIDYGLPSVYHPDETRQILDSLSMASRLNILPMEFSYPAMHKYLLLSGFSLFYFLGRMLNIFSNPEDFAFLFFSRPEIFYLLARILSLALGMSTLIIVYKTAKEFFGRNCAIISLAISAIMFHLVGHSQWGLPDSLLIFLTTLSFYYLFKLWQGPSFKSAILLGIFSGLAISTKYQAVFLLVPISFLFVLRLIKRQKRTLRLGAVFLICLLIFSLLGNLSWLFKFEESSQRFLELSEEKMGISSTQPYKANLVSMSVWFIKEIIRQETVIGFFILFGIIYAIFKHSIYDYLFVLYILAYFWFVSAWGVRYLHILVAAFPIMCIFAARAISELIDKVKKERYKLALNFVTPLTLIIPLINLIEADIKKCGLDSRVVAKNWIEENIPSGTRIAIDWYDFGPNLLTLPPRYFQDSKINPIYSAFLSQGLRNRLSQYVYGRPNYPTIQIIYSKDSPDFSEIPPQVVVKLKSSFIARRLYRWFNFYSLEDLEEKGVDLIVISSFCYNHFLLDTDPRKQSGLFNPYLREDTLSNNRQVDYYDDESKHGLLFYLNKRSRDYYSAFFEKSEKLELVKEFIPENQALSPYLRIYKLKN